MCKRVTKGRPYPFSWLDELVEVTLNPEKTAIEKIPAEVLQNIREKLPVELQQINEQLKSQAFCLYRDHQLRSVAGHYDQAIHLLQQQMRIHLTQYPESSLLHQTGQFLLDALSDLDQNVRQRYSAYLTSSPDNQEEQAPSFKIRCRLSVDQIALILKAADSLQLVVARSFSQVLRSIVPYLSTERFTDFSWKSARSSTYKTEDNDKEAVIQVLEAMIARIRDL